MIFALLMLAALPAPTPEESKPLALMAQRWLAEAGPQGLTSDELRKCLDAEFAGASEEDPDAVLTEGEVLDALIALMQASLIVSDNGYPAVYRARASC